MSLLFTRSEERSGDFSMWSQGGYAGRTQRATVASSDRARRQSVVWAATRLRADLESSLPLDAYRQVGRIAVPVPKPALFVEPSFIAEGQPVTWREWTYSSRVGLDTDGNSIGLILARDGAMKPARIELVGVDNWTARLSANSRHVVEYRVDGTAVDPRNIWHERQHTIPGFALGLSSVAYAAAQIAVAQGAQDFARDWFQNGTFPGAILRNTVKALLDDEADKTKARLLATIRNGEPFVTGKDWEYSPVAAKAAEAGFIEQQRFTDVDMARFIGVPANTVDAAVENSSVTYTNLSQDQLHLLIRHIGPALARREEAWSRLMPAPRFVRFNVEAFLRMDPKEQAEVERTRIASKTLAPSEARAQRDLEPFTPEQIAEMKELGVIPTPAQPGTTTGVNP